MVQSGSGSSFSLEPELINFLFNDTNQPSGIKQRLVQPGEIAREQSGDQGGDGRDGGADQVISWEVNSITTGNSRGERGPIKGSRTATKESVI